jgi:hypothetical protein
VTSPETTQEGFDAEPVPVGQRTGAARRCPGRTCRILRHGVVVHLWQETGVSTAEIAKNDLVLEPVLPDRLGTAEAGAVVMSDIAMLVYTGGRERTRAEFERLLAAGGFGLAYVTLPLGGTPTRIVVAHPR